MKLISIFTIAASLLFHSISAGAAEIRVVSVLAMKSALISFAGEFERSSGHKLILSFGTVNQVQSRVGAGEAFDVVFTNAPAVDDLITKGKIAPGSRINVATVRIGVAVRADAPKPDIGSVDAFKQALLTAKSISRGDPGAGGAAGVHVAGVLVRLGIDAEVKAKSKLAAGHAISEMVARGEAEIAIALISEIVTVQGVALVGPLPKELEFVNVLSAGTPTTASQSQSARVLIDALKGPAGTSTLKKSGLEPG